MLVHRLKYSAGIGILTPNAKIFSVNKNENALFPYYFNDLIDEIRIYNKPLPDQETGYPIILKARRLKVSGKIVYQRLF